MSSERTHFRKKVPNFSLPMLSRGKGDSTRPNRMQWHPVMTEYEVSRDIKMWAWKRVEVAWVSFFEELTF